MKQSKLKPRAKKKPLLICTESLTREFERPYRIAKQRDRPLNDIQHLKVIKHVDSGLLAEECTVLKRWKSYFEYLMNTENPRESLN